MAALLVAGALVVVPAVPEAAALSGELLEVPEDDVVAVLAGAACRGAYAGATRRCDWVDVEMLNASAAVSWPGFAAAVGGADCVGPAGRPGAAVGPAAPEVPVGVGDAVPDGTAVGGAAPEPAGWAEAAATSAEAPLGTPEPGPWDANGMTMAAPHATAVSGMVRRNRLGGRLWAATSATPSTPPTG